MISRALVAIFLAVTGHMAGQTMNRSQVAFGYLVQAYQCSTNANAPCVKQAVAMAIQNMPELLNVPETQIVLRTLGFDNAPAAAFGRPPQGVYDPDGRRGDP